MKSLEHNEHLNEACVSFKHYNKKQLPGHTYFQKMYKLEIR